MSFVLEDKRIEHKKGDVKIRPQTFKKGDLTIKPTSLAINFPVNPPERHYVIQINLKPRMDVTDLARWAPGMIKGIASSLRFPSKRSG